MARLPINSFMKSFAGKSSLSGKNLRRFENMLDKGFNLLDKKTQNKINYAYRKGLLSLDDFIPNDYTGKSGAFTTGSVKSFFGDLKSHSNKQISNNVKPDIKRKLSSRKIMKEENTVNRLNSFREQQLVNNDYNTMLESNRFGEDITGAYKFDFIKRVKATGIGSNEGSVAKKLGSDTSNLNYSNILTKRNIANSQQGRESSNFNSFQGRLKRRINETKSAISSKADDFSRMRMEKQGWFGKSLDDTIDPNMSKMEYIDDLSNRGVISHDKFMSLYDNNDIIYNAKTAEDVINIEIASRKAKSQEFLTNKARRRATLPQRMAERSRRNGSNKGLTRDEILDINNVIPDHLNIPKGSGWKKTNPGSTGSKVQDDAIENAPGWWGKMSDAKVPQAVAGIGMTAWLVHSLSDNRGQMSNSQLYGQ